MRDHYTGDEGIFFKLIVYVPAGIALAYGIYFIGRFFVFGEFPL